jgi:hypothetical protein
VPRKASPRSSNASKPKSGLLPLPQYKSLIEGLMSQGLPHADAVATLSAGLQQANGRPARQEAAVA